MQRTSYRTIILLAGAAVTTPTPSVAANQLSAYAGEVFQQLAVEHDIPGLAVAVIADDQAQFFNFGVASRTSGELVDETTIFEVGSISKVFTATLGSRAVATGRMSLGDHPGQYLAGWPARTPTRPHC
jgi:beta-lactamase class C